MFQKTVTTIKYDIINAVNLMKTEDSSSIDIGSSIPLQFFEKEDNLRSLFKIKGIPNIKNHYNKILRDELIKETGYLIDHQTPDIKIEINIDKKLNHEITYKTKELLLLGQYNKYQRGISQRFKKNIHSNNSDSQSENFNEQNNNTIEYFILEFLYSKTGSKDITIGWLGSEDKNSLVLGKGRPFFVKINSPKIREFEKDVDIKNELHFKFQEIKLFDQHLYEKYKIQIKLLIKVLNDEILLPDLEQNISKFIGEISFFIKKKIIKKRIYSAAFKILDKSNFELDLVLDNGIPIKQLIGGNEYIEPSLSKILNKKCECTIFDIIDVIPSLANG
ncbi:MAG TPA: hypothetical protein VIY08_04240 [Candidatus Nitrosocosmicus sp.]